MSFLSGNSSVFNTSVIGWRCACEVVDDCRISGDFRERGCWQLTSRTLLLVLYNWNSERNSASNKWWLETKLRSLLLGRKFQFQHFHCKTWCIMFEENLYVPTKRRKSTRCESFIQFTSSAFSSSTGKSNIFVKESSTMIDVVFYGFQGHLPQMCCFDCRLLPCWKKWPS